MERIGLMGGSFNPIHVGHVNMARTALEGGYVDRVIFLPSGNPPHKRAGLEDKLDRYEMTRLAISGEERMSVSREEIDREGVIYTVDTLTSLKAQMPDAQLFYLIGADTLCVLHTWRRAEDVIKLCAFLVVMRPGEDEAQVMAAAQRWRAKGAEISFLPARMMDISSTQIRERMADGRPLDDLVPPQVEAYIRENDLYQTHGV